MDDLVLWGESEEDRREMIGLRWSMEEEGLKVNAYNSKVMVLGGEEESVW